MLKPLICAEVDDRAVLRQADGLARPAAPRTRSMQATIERLTLLGRVAEAAHVEPRAEHVLAIEADLRGREHAQAPHEQAGDDEEQQAERHLRGDERPAGEERPAADQPDRARLELERLRDRHARAAKRRQQTAGEARHERHAGGEGDHAPVDPGVERDERALSAGKESEQEIAAPHGEAQADRAAGETEKQALDEKLADEPHAPGAERQAHGNLALARRRPRHQQAGDVAAGNQEQHDHHREEDVQRGRGLIAERGQAAAGRRQHDALGAETVGGSRGRRRGATRRRHDDER